MKYLFSLLVLFSTFSMFAQLPSYVPTNGLVGYWPFNGNANDESGNAINGIVNGATLTTDRFGVANKAYNFVGNNWIQCAFNQNLNVGTGSFTISCWALKNGTNTFQHFVTRMQISTWPNVSASYALRYEGAGLGMYASGNASNSNGSTATNTISNLSNWNHFIGVYNASVGTMSIYVNGVLSITSPISSTPQNYDNNGGLFFGVEHPTVSLPSGPQFLTGKLDDIGIWNRALTQQEITNLFTSSIPPVTCNITTSDSTLCLGESTTLTSTAPSSSNASFCTSASLPSNLQTGLVGYWPFCGNANDASGNGNHGNVNGASLTSDRFGNANCAYNFTQGTWFEKSLDMNPAFTVSLWANFQNFQNSYQCLFQHKNICAGGGGHNLGTQNTGLRYFSHICGACCQGVYPNHLNISSLSANNWGHYVVTSDGISTIRVYLNNVQIDSIIGSAATLDFGNVPFLLAKWLDGSDLYFSNIKLDDVAYWHRTLSPSEIQQLFTQGQTTYAWSPGNATTPSITVSPTTTTTYTCTTTVNGVACTDAINVTVDSLNFSLPATTTVCGTSTTLSAPAGATTYLWSTGATTASISPSINGLYSCTVTKGACIKSDSTQLYLVNSTITATDSTLCLGESTTLSVASTIPAINCTSLPGTLSNGLVGYWPFCGNANDASGNGNNGLVNGATLTTDRFGNANNAYDFNGVNSNIIIPHSEIYNFNTTDSYSISLWAKADVINNVNDYYIFQKWNNSLSQPYPYSIRMDYNRIRAWRFLSGNSPFDSLEVNRGDYISPIDVTKFYNITVLYKSDSLALYIDGNLVAKNKNYLPSTITKNTSNISIGSSLLNSWFFDGKIDDIAIWNRTLSASEIQQLYTQGQTTYSWSPGGATTPSISVSPTATTMYTCTTTVNGVACTDAITVTVDSLNFSLPATTTFCGTSTTLSAPAGATSYLWNTNATTASISPTTSGLYSCTVTKGACVKSDSTQLYLVNSTITATDSTLCLGESTTLSVANAPTSVSTNCGTLTGTLATGLVGYWPFCGNVNDVSGNGNNGTVNGATLTTDRFGNSNSSLQLTNGVQIMCTNNLANNPNQFSISLWFNSSNTSIISAEGLGRIFGFDNGQCQHIFNQDRYIDLMANGQVRFHVNHTTGNYFCYSNPGKNDGLWHYVVCTFGIDGMKIYVDNVLEGSNANNLISSYNGYWRVGGLNDLNSPSFIGSVDDISLYNKVLIPSEIQQLYTQGQTTYAWSPGGATTPSITVSPTATTTYTCTTTVNGVACTDAITVTVDALNFSLPATTTVCGTSTTLSAPAGATSYLWNTNATTASITPTSSGIYSCTVTKGACVKSASTQLVMLNPIVSTADSILCVGDNTTLTSNTTVSPSSICSGAALPTNLQTGLVGYWPFCGNANDASGNGNNGTVNGATLTTDRFGNSNSAFSFDGNDWISATRAHQAVFTASMWVQATNASCIKPILDANDKSWELYSDCSNGQLNFKLWNGGTFTLYPTNIVLGTNTWYHVVAVYASSQVKIYVNGSLITTQVTTAVPAISGVLNIGASLSGSSQYFTGKLDDIGIWSRALTLAEIQQLYAQGETTYSWSPGGATTQSITVSPTTTTTYTCTTTVNGASCSDAIVVTVNPLPSVNAGTDQSVCLNQPVTLSGSGATSYSWNNSVINNTPFTPTATATYTVTGTDANGCVNTDNVLVTIKPLPATNAGLDQSICIGNQAIFNATGAFSYSWSNGVANNVPFFPTTTANYIVTGTNTNGCTKTDTMTITVNALPIVNAGSDTSVCFGQNATLTATGAVSYSWVPGNATTASITVSPTVTTSYIVTGTNANACQGKDTVIVTIKPLPSINAGSDKTICAGDSVALTASGSPLITWNNGILNGVYFYPTATTTYTVTGTGANGCTNTDQAVVFVNALPNVNAGADTAVCNGSFLTLSGSGAVSYTWSNSVTNNVPFIPSLSNTFTVVGTDANGCKDSDQIQVTVNVLPPVNAGNNVAICIGDSIQLNGSGAVSYVWDNGVINNTAFYPTSTLTYHVIGTNANGCSNSDSVIVTVNPLPTVFAGNDTLLCDQSTYTLSGLGATTYTWNNGVTNGVPFTVTANTTYTVQGIDGNGCQNSDQVTLTTKPLPTVDAGSDKAVCYGDSLFFTATGTGVSYSWSNGLINGDYFIPTSNMTLTVTATGANGCTQTDQVLATVNPLPTVDAGPNRIICKGQAIALNAVSNGSIVWGGGVVNNLPFNPSTTTTYGVTATSAAGCVNTDDVTVTVGDYPNANFYTQTPTQYSPNSTFDFVNLSTGAATYDWDFGDLIGTSSVANPSYTYQPLVTATYFVTLVVSSTLGCKDSLTSIVQLINNSPGLDVIIPTGFSPNNDSDNDDWTIYGIENYPNSKISVFNRWGLKVFEGSELFPTWNGIYGGVMLPTADYYYIVELSDGRKFNGVVTLKQ